MIVPVILSGGAGSRLWPLSREGFPKQFHCLTDPELSLLQQTVTRLQGVAQLQPPVVVCNEDHRFLVAEQLRSAGVEGARILLEPVARNTAPAVAVAALCALESGADAMVLVLPADHAIARPEALVDGVNACSDAARGGALVTFGIVPTRAETGYGYIRRNAPATPDATVFPVAEFVEKPDAQRAAAYLASGDYAWNSGMFLFRADTYLEELGRFEPDTLAACRAAWEGATQDLDFCRLAAEPFAAARSDSIDYAVMERTAAAVVKPLDAGWNDIGSWDALMEVLGGDADHNLLQGDVVARDVAGSFIRSESRLVGAIGIRDQIVVETADAVLVADRGQAQQVKQLVADLAASGRSERVLHQRVFRPWGAYESLVASERFQVKRITVNPGASLSLQMHHHRAEHWIVVTGTARVTRGEEVFMLGEDESTYIPLGARHRLENPGKIPLELIEVQSGSYLGEDDIVRFEDSYGR